MNKECCAASNYRRDLGSRNRPRIANERKTRRSNIKELNRSGIGIYPGSVRAKRIIL
jgi:hypothetical protein